MKLKKNILFWFLLIFSLNFNLFCIEPLGLTNLGNTCFLNATIQCLHSIEKLTDFFEKDENKNLYEDGSVADEYSKFIQQYKTEFEKAGLAKKDASFAPQNFVNKIWSLKDIGGEDKFPAGATGDSQELLAIILDSFNSDIKPNKIKEYYGFPFNNIAKTWVGQNLFNWFIKETLTYKEIKRPGKVNLMQSLPLAVREITSVTDTGIKYKNYKNLNECLKAFFAQEEVEYKIYEEGKPKIYTMKRSKEIATLPEIFVLGYKRYEFDYETLTKRKITRGIPFEFKNLDLKEFVSPEVSDKIQTKYDLIAISIHHGEGAHYTAFIKSNGKWYNCDDSWVQQVKEKDIKELANLTGEDLHQTPYLLFYKQQPKAKDIAKIEPITTKQVIKQLTKVVSHYELDDYLGAKNIKSQDLVNGINDQIINFDYIELDIKEYIEEKTRKNLSNLRKFSSSLIPLNNRWVALAKG